MRMKANRKDKQKLILEDICPDINQWPESWSGDSDDILPGKKLLSQFKLFIQAQIDKGRVKATIRSHSNYLWALGGEVIRDISNNDDYNQNLMDYELLMKYVSESGGPYWRDAYDTNDHKKYDSVCRMLYKFMNHV